MSEACGLRPGGGEAGGGFVRREGVRSIHGVACCGLALLL